jgi:branched-chain amino acid transport system permease protein
VSIDLPQGSRLIFLGAIMAVVLILRPSGLTGGREFGLPRRRRRMRWTRGDSAQPA